MKKFLQALNNLAALQNHDANQHGLGFGKTDSSVIRLSHDLENTGLVKENLKLVQSDSVRRVEMGVNK